MSQMSKIHIWIGYTNKSEEDYLKYFELDYSTEGDFDDPDYKVCDFCKDINEKWYNEDFIGIIPLFKEEISVNELLKNIPIAHKEIEKVILKCEDSGIEKGNAIFYLTDSEIIVPKPYKNSYNDLKYIGEFDSSLNQ